MANPRIPCFVYVFPLGMPFAVSGFLGDNLIWIIYIYSI